MFGVLVCAWASMAALRPSVAQAESPAADDLFDGDQLHDIWIRINARDLAQLRDNYLENTYYPCDVEWNGITVRNAGIRSHGRTSRSPHKPAFRLDFNRYVGGQEYLGLKSLVLDNLWQDSSMLRERLAMLLFRRVALPAPRVSHARVYLGSEREFAGVYGVVEAIDKPFLKRHFDEDDGYLYEYRWRDEYRFEDVSSLDWYAARFDPKTHERESTSALFGPLRELVRTINIAREHELETALAPHLNLRTFINHIAIENFLSEPDGILGGLGMNNFYLYRFEGKDLWQLIPWDKDLAFESLETPRPWDNVDENILARKIWAVPELRRTYLRTLLDIAQSAGPPSGRPDVDPSTRACPAPPGQPPCGWLEEEVFREYAQVREAALADPRTPYSNAQFEQAAEFLKRFARLRGTVVRQFVTEVDPGLLATVSDSERFRSRGIRTTPE